MGNQTGKGKNNKKNFIQDISTAKIEIEESNNIDNN